MQDIPYSPISVHTAFLMTQSSIQKLLILTQNRLVNNGALLTKFSPVGPPLVNESAAATSMQDLRSIRGEMSYMINVHSVLVVPVDT